MTSLAHKTIAGVLWSFAQQLAVKGISVAVTLLLAHFLAPEDFGLVAMMAVFLNIASSLMDSGLAQALIRKAEAMQEDLNTAFFANLALGFCAYVLLFIVSPAIANFYDEPRLIVLVRVAALAVIIDSFKIVQFTVLSRQLNFRAQFRATLPASLISANVAIVMAYLGYGVWALIVQMLVSAFFVTFFLWIQGLWRPSLALSASSFKEMYRFGYKMFLSGLLDTVFKNIYVIVIAKLFSTTSAGLYFFADRIRELVIYQIVSSIQKVTYPALATLESDNEKLKDGYRKVISVSTFILFPIILFMAALAEPLFRLFLPEKWWPALIYLQLMCMAGLLIPVHAINLNIVKVKGRSDLFLLLEVIKKTILTAILMISFRYGIIGILIGQIISSVLAYLPNSFYSKRLIDYSVKEQLTDFVPCLILTGLIGISLWQLEQLVNWDALVKLSVFGLSGFIAYLLGAYIFKLRAYSFSCELIINKMKREN